MLQTRSSSSRFTASLVRATPARNSANRDAFSRLSPKAFLPPSTESCQNPRQRTPNIKLSKSKSCPAAFFSRHSRRDQESSELGYSVLLQLLTGIRPESCPSVVPALSHVRLGQTTHLFISSYSQFLLPNRRFSRKC